MPRPRKASVADEFLDAMSPGEQSFFGEQLYWAHYAWAVARGKVPVDRRTFLRALKARWPSQAEAKDLASVVISGVQLPDGAADPSPDLEEVILSELASGRPLGRVLEDLGISPRQFAMWRLRNPGLDARIRVVMVARSQMVMDKLYEMAVGGDLEAIRLWMQMEERILSRLESREKKQVTVYKMVEVIGTQEGTVDSLRGAGGQAHPALPPGPAEGLGEQGSIRAGAGGDTGREDELRSLVAVSGDSDEGTG